MIAALLCLLPPVLILALALLDVVRERRRLDRVDLDRAPDDRASKL